jgi:hypothetical protein
MARLIERLIELLRVVSGIVKNFFTDTSEQFKIYTMIFWILVLILVLHLVLAYPNYCILTECGPTGGLLL